MTLEYYNELTRKNNVLPLKIRDCKNNIIEIKNEIAQDMNNEYLNDRLERENIKLLQLYNQGVSSLGSHQFELKKEMTKEESDKF